MYTYTFKIQSKGQPVYSIPSNDQMMLSPQGRILVCYPDDHDADPNAWHDVTDQYDIDVQVVEDMSRTDVHAKDKHSEN